MSVSKILKKAATKYVGKFKKDPEKMAASYAFLGVGACLAYVGLIMATRELEKKENEIINLEFVIAWHNAYMNGVYDGFKKYNTQECQNQW
mgnify:CR=1 FL=1